MRTELAIWSLTNHVLNGYGLASHPWNIGLFATIPEPYQGGTRVNLVPWRDNFNDDHALNHRLRMGTYRGVVPFS